MKLERYIGAFRPPSRITLGVPYSFRNGFTLEKGTHGQLTLKFGVHQVTFHRKLVSTGYRRNRVEYIFFRGSEEPLRFAKLQPALEHAAELVAARDAAMRLGAPS